VEDEIRDKQGRGQITVCYAMAKEFGLYSGVNENIVRNSLIIGLI